MIVRRLKFGAVLVGVVLSLTGFSRGHGSSHGSSHSHSYGHGSSHSSSGGGCSSHKTHNNDYSSSNRNSDDSTPTHAAKPTTTPSATGTVDTCVRPGTTSATVRVSATSGSGKRTYRVDMSFLGANGSVVDTGMADVDLSGSRGATATVKVPMNVASEVASVDHCRVDSVSFQYQY
ncbi:hypothetical protein [Streptomyces sp. NBC_01766]|uniref:hypothetical protein n=1 Tax=Streptomyces sp. NBC_01766 TaxID=2975936 RepID=UPI002DDC6D90|nr:hypothetical protein [Streptomyces sp. NBC_01766]WSC21751.1 hypothetical protein OIE60_19845 [Streptomyces sp. NBC_01766]